MDGGGAGVERAGGTGAGAGGGESRGWGAGACEGVGGGVEWGGGEEGEGGGGGGEEALMDGGCRIPNTRALSEGRGGYVISYSDIDISDIFMPDVSEHDFSKGFATARVLPTMHDLLCGCKEYCT